MVVLNLVLNRVIVKQVVVIIILYAFELIQLPKGGVIKLMPIIAASSG